MTARGAHVSFSDEHAVSGTPAAVESTRRQLNRAAVAPRARRVGYR